MKFYRIVVLIAAGVTFAASHIWAQDFSLKTLYTFHCIQQPSGLQVYCPKGAAPVSFFQDADGSIYGAAAETLTREASNPFATTLGGVIFHLDGSSYTVIHAFSPTGSSYLGGSTPSVLIKGTDGMLYGTTSFGGQYNRGTVYRMSSTGANFQILYQFCPQAACLDGFDPNSLIYSSDGNLYGTTLQGGLSADTCTFFAYGCGTAFKISPSTGVFTLLHTFDPNADGSSPFAIMQASNGTIYGITNYNDYSPDPAQLFTISLSGDFGHLITFPGPVAGGITEGSDRKIYGVANNDQTGFALFSVNLDGSGLQISKDAFGTYGATTPTLGRDGNYYLTSGTELGGHITIGSAIYKVSPAGQVLSTLYFDAGYNPTTPLVLTPSGTFLGTTVSGGENYQPPAGSPYFLGSGIIYEVSSTTNQALGFVQDRE